MSKEIKNNSLFEVVNESELAALSGGGGKNIEGSGNGGNVGNGGHSITKDGTYTGGNGSVKPGK
jgi:hypothetical protein